MVLLRVRRAGSCGSDQLNGFSRLAVLLGYPILGIWYWCADQTHVQRVLAARGLKDGQNGALFAGFLKITPVFLMVLPGLVAYVLWQMSAFQLNNVPGTNSPDYNTMLPVMINHLVPVGLRGVARGLHGGRLDELHGSGVEQLRDITLHSSQPGAPHEWHESIVVMGQGFSPQNSIDPTGLTLVDASGERADFSWQDATPPKKPGKPERPVIHLVNTKSQFKPFAILRPQDQPTIDIFTGEIRRDVSIYPWWNHWPTAKFASDGRYAVAADRVSHSSLSHLIWNTYETGPDWMRKLMLVGLTQERAETLLPLSRSWSAPAQMKLTGAGYGSSGFDPGQKAYSLAAGRPGAKLSFTLAASAESPLLNPAFVILGWGAQEAKVTLNGNAVAPGDTLRIGHRRTIDSEDLIVWLRAESQSVLEVRIEPQ